MNADVSGVRDWPVDLIESCNEGIVLTDRKGFILKANQAFKSFTGRTDFQPTDLLLNLLNFGREDANFYQQVWDVLLAVGHWSGEVWHRHADGEIYPEWLSISALRNDQGELLNFLGIFVDISSERQTQRIQQLAFYDQLTNLPNRSLLEDRLGLALTSATRSGQKSALLVIDLDQFKSINDSLGHAIGDLLLQKAATRISQCVREGDTVARLGGDEFAIILSPLSQDYSESVAAVAAVAEKIGIALAPPYIVGEFNIIMTASIGIAISPDDADSTGELLRKADTAMYHAKKQGRDNYQFHTNQMNIEAQKRLYIEHQLRRAIEETVFEIYYQPQVLNNGQLVGVEALLRWPDSQIETSRVIAVAEETGLIVSLGLWVLKQACKQMKAWENAGLHKIIPCVAVNVSPRQFRQPNFVETLEAVLKSTGLDPSMLELELTESCLIDDVFATSEKLNKIKDIGVKLSVDDFGTGYSSLSYLKHFPLDTLKIDRSFVMDIERDNSDATITSTIILMAQSLGLGVIAEGVESSRQLDILHSYGCKLYQGYLFSPALSAIALETRLEQEQGLISPG
jgi:diguanylate cyclase (GGDEF)-like protein/PAS domain S-box-containing protein